MAAAVADKGLNRTANQLLNQSQQARASSGNVKWSMLKNYFVLAAGFSIRL